MAVGSRDEDKGAGGPRTRYGVICLTHGNAKVALVRSNATETWQFPSVLLDRDAEPLEEQLEAALDVAQQQLGIDVTEHLCSQPVIHALGPEPRVSTKFFMAFNVPEAPLAPATPMGAGAAQGAPAASWEDLQGLLEETAQEAVAGNQLVAVLRQLQSMAKRRYELLMPADDGYQEVAALLSWHEGGPWRGPHPKAFLEQHCRDHRLPAPAFNVFEHNRGGGGGGGASGASGGDAKRTHFCATAILPHLALQLTPDAVYTSPVDALENAALLALLYLLGALEPDCPLVHYAPAGDMAQVPHAFVTEHELRQGAVAVAGEADRAKRELEKQVQREQAALQRRMDELKRQQAALAAGGVPAAAASQGVATNGGGERAAKRAKADKPPPGVASALVQIPLDRHPLMTLKELCDKCRFAPPRYEEVRGQDGRYTMAVLLPEAGLPRVSGAPCDDRKQAKFLAAEAAVAELRRRYPSAE